ncbi:hypothetical protein ACLB2K_025607 [Fragaria x ananassa]
MKTYIVGSDGASRVSGDKFELHVNLAEEIFLCGFKTRARGFVERESKKLAVVEYRGSTVPPCNLKVLVEVTRRCNHNKASKQKWYKQKH